MTFALWAHCYWPTELRVKMNPFDVPRMGFSKKRPKLRLTYPAQETDRGVGSIVGAECRGRTASPDWKSGTLAIKLHPAWSGDCDKTAYHPAFEPTIGIEPHPMITSQVLCQLSYSWRIMSFMLQAQTQSSPYVPITREKARLLITFHAVCILWSVKNCR